MISLGIIFDFDEKKSQKKKSKKEINIYQKIHSSIVKCFI